jgi:hypothetical protein
VEQWQGIILAGITLIGTLYAAYRAGKTTVKVKELDVDGQAFDRAKGIYSDAIATLQKQYADLEKQRTDDKAEHASELGKLGERMERIQREVDKVRDQNNALVTFVYKMLAILRSHNLTDEINPHDVPDGIHI